MNKFIKSELLVKASPELEDEVENERAKAGEQLDINTIIGRYGDRGICASGGVRSEQPGDDV